MGPSGGPGLLARQQLSQDELEKTLRERTALPGPETFHLAHLLFQVAEGLLTGTNAQNHNKGQANTWTQHVFSSQDGHGEQLVTEMFARLEFQDGKRRRHTGPSQSYHGSGRAHLHMLVWLKHPEKVAWNEVLRADFPSGRVEPELRSLVEGSQLDWEKSGWPQREGPTAWTEGCLLLQHTADAHAAHVRAWMPDVLGAMQCHMDVQAGDGRGLLLQYTASYTSKFSDQFATSWLNEEATDYHLARKILSEYLWQHLCPSRFQRSILLGFTSKVFYVSACSSTIFRQYTYKLTLAHPFPSNVKLIALFWQRSVCFCFR